MSNSETEDGASTDPLKSAATTAENMSKAYALAQETWAFYLSKQGNGRSVDLDPYRLGPAIADLQKAIATDPKAMLDASVELWQKQAQLWTDALGRLAGSEPENPVIPITDKRLASDEWDSNLVFHYLRQSYTLTSGWMRDAVQRLDKDLPELERAKLEFFTERFTEAMSPRNVFAMNPEVLQRTADENGENIVRGFKRLLEDMKRGDGELLISQTDMSAFEIGENIATTPGSVIFRNKLFELIQYAPTTEETHTVPLLIAPPWINKFYILDLNERKSLIRWLVAQGFSVFVISWKNPEASKRSRDFHDYVTEGFYEAIDAILKETGEEQVNTVGYCIGGTMQATALAHMAQTGDKRIKSATFFTAQADFRKAGDLRIFADDWALDALKEEGERSGGVINAQQMAGAFNMLRGNELIWDYVVDNYYLGKEPSAFDLLYWNADSTRMPATCHISYLRDFYRDNLLAEGKMELSGKALDLSKVEIPVYSVSARDDHIAPAESVFRSMKLMSGPIRFVVGGSGHIAGVVNPPNPDKVKYQYWTSETPRDGWPDLVDDWVAAAQETPGSWWPDWAHWLSEHSGEMMAAREPGAVLEALEPAPGSEVKVRSDASAAQKSDENASA